MFESFVNSDGVNIWTTRTGEGYPVMLCNGGAGCCDYLEPVAGMLDDMAQVIRFEQRGCGRSQPVPPYDIETCLVDLENIRRHYQIDRWIIGGHSWGADLALIYALEHASHVAGLICIAGGRIHNDREWHDEYERRKEQEGERLPEFDYPPNMEVNKQLNRSWKRYVQRPTLLRAISRLEIPALFVYGTRDIRPGWPVEQVAHLMPDARFELMEGAEHVIWFSHPNELRSLLRNFVDDIIVKGGGELR
jgi:proline iminopeptidase